VSPEETYLAVLGDQIRRPRSILDLGQLMARRQDAFAIVLCNEASSVARITAIHSQLQHVVSDLSPNRELVAAPLVRSLVAPQIVGETAESTTVLICAFSERIFVVGRLSLTMFAPLTFSHGPISWSAFNSLLTTTARSSNSAAPSELLVAIDSLLASRVVADLNSQYQEYLLRSKRVLDNSADVDEALRTFSGLSELQLHASGLVAIYQQYDNNEQSVLPTLNFILATTLSLSGTVQNNLMLRYQRSDADYQDEVDARAADFNKRANRLTKLAASLLMPSLWFGLLGANVFPSTLHGVPVNGGYALFAAILGAFAFGLVGYFITWLLTRGSE
jgi:hypothetical protein